ncbi:MAG: hypothetical protein IKV91_06200 [Bacteroidales bacterium]|nr:hypothetical protein [Bacteroidales bacterium]
MAQNILHDLSELSSYKESLLNTNEINSGTDNPVCTPPSDTLNKTIDTKEHVQGLRLRYDEHMQAVIAAIRLIPYFFEKHNKVTKVSYSEQYQVINIKTGDNHLFRIKWEKPGRLKSIGCANRYFAFVSVMIGYAYFSKLDKTKAEIIENAKARIFTLYVNDVAILRSSYKTNNVRKLDEFIAVRDAVLDNPITNKVLYVEALDFVDKIKPVYNEFSFPKVLKSIKPTSDITFNFTSKISVYKQNLFISPTTSKPHIPVGVCLDSTSDRRDRFDHDD